MLRAPLLCFVLVRALVLLVFVCMSGHFLAGSIHWWYSEKAGDLGRWGGKEHAMGRENINNLLDRVYGRIACLLVEVKALEWNLESRRNLAQVKFIRD